MRKNGQVKRVTWLFRSDPSMDPRQSLQQCQWQFVSITSSKRRETYLLISHPPVTAANICLAAISVINSPRPPLAPPIILSPSPPPPACIVEKAVTAAAAAVAVVGAPRSNAVVTSQRHERVEQWAYVGPAYYGLPHILSHAPASP